MLSVAFLFASILAASAAPDGFKTLVRHEERLAAPASFINKGAAPADAPLNLRIALTQSNTPGLIDALYEVSDPAGAKYGEFLSKDDVEKYVAPSPESLSVVNAWLSANGIDGKSISPAGDWIGFTTTVGKASELLDADFAVFQHSTTGQETIRTLGYSIPSALKPHLELVHPTISFPNPDLVKPNVMSPVPMRARGDGSGGNVPASCRTLTTPACLQAIYGIPTTPATQPSNRLAVSGFIKQFANRADLKTFLTKFRPDISPATTFTLQTLDGGENPQDPADAGIEANLDVQYTVGIATGVPTYFISVGEQNQDGDLGGFLDIVNALLTQASPPQVLTTSYGFKESDISPKLANILCNAYAQLGARGTSAIFSSGDGGVGGSAFPADETCKVFVPTFPSGCPFVTSVGSTTGFAPETAANFSSGGFSNIFPIPSYQADAVAEYKQQIGNEYAGRFNTSGRGFPDVSVQGTNFAIFIKGEADEVLGTSASAPTFASMVSLINDELIAAGKPSLGFLNPLIYGKAKPVFTDIIGGSNPGCSTKGFEALKGWDPVTGLGSPSFFKLKDVCM